MIGTKRNNVKNVSRRQIQTLIEMKNVSNRIEKLSEPIEKNVCKTLQDWQNIQFHVPNPKGSAPAPMQVTQEEEEKPTVQRSRHVQQLEPIQLQSPRNAAVIYQDAVYSVLSNSFLVDIPHTIPMKFQYSKFVCSPPDGCQGTL